MTYNEFEGKPLIWDQPLYKDQTSRPQCSPSLEVSLCMQHVSSLLRAGLLDFGWIITYVISWVQGVHYNFIMQNGC